MYVCLSVPYARPNYWVELAEIWHAGLFWANLKHGRGPVSKFWLFVSRFGHFGF